MKAVWINNDADALGPLAKGLERDGVSIVQTYMHQRDVLEALKAGLFPQVDVILTQVSLPRVPPDFNSACNGVELVRRIRAAGVTTPIIALDVGISFQACGFGDVAKLRRLGVVIDRERFGIPKRVDDIASGIKDVLASHTTESSTR